MSCSCTNKNDTPKKLYLTNGDAKYVAKEQNDKNDVDLKIYPCPEGKGYHLTSI